MQFSYKKTQFNSCIAPWVLLQHTLILYYSCPLHMYTENLIEFALIVAIHEILTINLKQLFVILKGIPMA